MADLVLRSRISGRFAILTLSLALLGAASMIGYHLGLFIPRMLAVRALNGDTRGYSFGDDFYPIWLTARQWRIEHLDLYGREMTREIQTGLFGHALEPKDPMGRSTDYRQFAYPAFTDLLLWPATLLEFPRLRLLLAVVLPILTALSIAFWILALDWHISALRLASIVVLTLGTYELLEAFFAEQPGLLVSFFLAGAALALRRNRLLLAGVLMSLTTIKPQVTILAAMYMLMWSFADRERKRFWVGFLSVVAGLVAASVWVWPHWIEEWIGILTGYHRYAMPPLISVLLGPRLSVYVGPVLIGAALTVGAILAWRTRQAGVESQTFWRTVSLLLALTSIALLPGQAIYDHVVLIPGILLLLQCWRRLRDAGPVSRTLLWAAAVVLMWPWVSAFALLVLRSIAPALSNSDAIFVMPIRTAASLPFAVIALLAYLKPAELRSKS